MSTRLNQNSPVSMNKIQKIVLSTMLVLFLHAIEEYFTNFYNLDFSTIEASKLLHISPAAFWLIGQGIVLTFLIFSIVVILPRRIPIWFAVIMGVAFIIELSHPYSAIVSRAYFPGLITSLVFPILGYYFFREYWHYLHANKTPY